MAELIELATLSSPFLLLFRARSASAASRCRFFRAASRARFSSASGLPRRAALRSASRRRRFSAAEKGIASQSVRARAAYSRRRSWRWAARSRGTSNPTQAPAGLVSSSRSRLRTHLDVAQRSNCPSKIKNQFGYHAQDRRARREGRRRNEVPIDSGAPPSALQPATTRRSNSVGRWPRSGAGAEAENTRSCQGAGRFWNEDRLPPAEPGR